MRTSSEPSRFKTAIFVCTSLVLFSCRKFILSKFFRAFNFRCRLDLRKYFNTELFPIYGILSGTKLHAWPMDLAIIALVHVASRVQTPSDIMNLISGHKCVCVCVCVCVRAEGGLFISL